MSPRVPRHVPKALIQRYTDWHWGAPPDKVTYIPDALVPDLVGIGDLRQLEVDGQPVTFPDGCRVGFDPKHPRHRIYLVLSKEARETVRKRVKYAPRTMALQQIARAAGGSHVKARALPNVQAAPIGVCDAIVYYTYKKGEEEDAPAEYIHHFGHEHARGVKPILAADVSGRLWLCGGSYFAPLPGITG